MCLNEFVSAFKDQNVEETRQIYLLFVRQNIDIQKCFYFYNLMIQTKKMCYKYNAYLYYEPFEIKDFKSWDYFIIKNKKEILLQVYYTSNYDVQRIEDNLTALYL